MNIIRSGMRLSLVGLALLLSVSFSYAHGEKKQHDMTPPDSLAVSVAVDSKGKLWRVGVSDGYVQVAHSARFRQDVYQRRYTRIQKSKTSRRMGKFGRNSRLVKMAKST